MSTVGRFRSPPGPSATLAIACLCAAVLCGVANPTQAAPLPPGMAIANDAMPTAGGVIQPGGDTGFVAYSLTDAFGKVVGTGFVREIVLTGDTSGVPNLGGETFLYQVKVTSGTVGSVTMTSFKGWSTDASAVLGSAEPGLGWAATTPNGLVVGGMPIARSGEGSTVSFSFDDSKITGGDVTVDVMIVRTNSPEVPTW